MTSASANGQGTMRILVFAEVNLNITSGSTLWLASVTELFAGSGAATVDVLQLMPVKVRTVIQGLDANAAVRFVDPWERAQHDRAWQEVTAQTPKPRLSPESAAQAIDLLDREQPYDLFLIRGLETADVVSWNPRLAPRVWAYEVDPARFREPGQLTKLRRVAASCPRILVQTDEARRAIDDLLGDCPAAISLLPPMISEVVAEPHPAPNGAAPRLAYAGKFDEGYLLLEHLDAFRQIRRQLPNAEFHVMGATFRCSRAYERELRRRLCATPGVLWYGGLSRQEVASTLKAMDVASSWRHERFDESPELSTKLLEYAAVGLPALMNPNDVQVRVFGPAYPGYVTGEDEFVERFVAFATSPDLYRTASEQMRAAAEPFTMARLREQLIPLAREHAGSWRDGTSHPAGEASAGAPGRPVRIRVAGHDLKFMRDLLDHFGANDAYRLDIERWDEGAWEKLLNRAEADAWPDIVFCEWCHRNAEWYSRNKRPHQRLVIRLHRYEMGQRYVQLIKWENVDRIVFITDELRQEFLASVPSMVDRAIVIRNTVACDVLDRAKRPGAEFTLGLLGILPKRKAPRLAVRILEGLHAHDARYRLHIKGLHPWELPSVSADPTERSYYEALYRGIRSGDLTRSMTFSRHGPDVAEWFAGIGFVLSTSEDEGSHQAVAEGMASGCVPIIRGWDGAEWQYPAKYVLPFDEDAFVRSAVETILRFREPSVRCEVGEQAKRFVREHFDAALIGRQYDALFAQLLEGRGPINPDESRHEAH
ncbi:MAG TPA: hypothetical protein VH482_10455 [Thermomicrobiales bacterium]